MSNSPTERVYYRLRAPETEGISTAVSVRLDTQTNQLYVAVGSGKRRMYLTAAEAWTLWRCLSEALGALGDPPSHIRTNLRPSRRSK